MSQHEPLGFGHPKVQRLRRLVGRRSARYDEGAFVIEGPGLIAEAVAAGWSIEAQFVAPGGTPVYGASQVFELGVGVIERVASTETPQPLLAIAAMPARSLGDLVRPTFIAVAAAIADPGNLGTILRSAEAAGAEAVVTLAGTVDCYSPKVVRSSAGALFHIPVIGPATPADLSAMGLIVVGTSSHEGVAYSEFDWTQPVAVMVGNEAHGVSDDLAVDARVTIPHRGRAESLNVAMAATILCFEVARQRTHHASRS